MNKAELITTIIDLYDRAEAYERIPKKSALTECVKCDDQPNADLSFIDSCVLKAGKLHIVEKTLGYWRNVRVSRDEESGLLNVQTFDNWADHKLENVPEWISKREFIEYFHAELFDIYTEEKDKAIECLLEIEAEEAKEAE